MNWVLSFLDFDSEPPNFSDHVGIPGLDLSFDREGLPCRTRQRLLGPRRDSVIFSGASMSFDGGLRDLQWDSKGSGVPPPTSDRKGRLARVVEGGRTEVVRALLPSVSPEGLCESPPLTGRGGERINLE